METEQIKLGELINPTPLSYTIIVLIVLKQKQGRCIPLLTSRGC
jgi:hypothetical protein